jgi:aminoglycoside 6'-N-acetyltransferase I
VGGGERHLHSTDPIRVEAATPRDADAVTDLATAFFIEEDFPLPYEGLSERVERYLQMDRNAIFLARRGDGDPIAFATVATGFGLEYGWAAELEDLYVVPEERNRGIARALVDRVATWSRDRGCSALLVTVTPYGERSHALTAFYEGLGFESEGRRLLERRLE